MLLSIGLFSVIFVGIRSEPGRRSFTLIWRWLFGFWEAPSATAVAMAWHITGYNHQETGSRRKRKWENGIKIGREANDRSTA